MLVPFGTRVIDSDGNAVGTVRHVVLNAETRQVEGLVLHQGVLRTRELIVPIRNVANAGHTIQLTLKAADLESLPLFHAEHLRRMPDQWDMPVGFDEREFFMLGDSGLMDETFAKTSPAVSGTPKYVRDEDSVQDPEEPEIASGMAVYDSTGQRVGDVASVSIDPVSDKITWIAVRHGHLFARESTVPASMIASVTDRITLNAPAQTVKRLELA